MKTYCGYSLEAPRRGASNEYPQHMILLWNKKDISIFWMKKVPYLLLCICTDTCCLIWASYGLFPGCLIRASYIPFQGLFKIFIFTAYTWKYTLWVPTQQVCLTRAILVSTDNTHSGVEITRIIHYQIFHLMWSSVTAKPTVFHTHPNPYLFMNLSITE